MRDKLKTALDKVTADETLKQSTRAFLARQTDGFGAAKARPRTARRMTAAFACFALVLAGGTGWWAYFSPTCAISIDINPSVELGVNRFDKVVSVEGYGEDGEALAGTLDIRFLSYSDALNALLSDPTVEGYLAQDEVLSISVAGDNKAQAGAILAQAESCAAGTKNVYCHAANAEEVEHAHEAGLSFGKYQAFLILQSLDPTVTAEDVQSLTMREIRDRITALDPDTAQTLYGNSGSHGHSSGAGNGTSSGNGSGQGSGSGSGLSSDKGSSQVTGNGSGQGNGTGTGQGSSNGSGQGSGAGSGHGHGSHSGQ